MKPLIGINLDLEDGPPPLASVQSTYLEAVRLAGGIPVLIPPLGDSDLAVVLTKLQGLLLTGGDDYSPGIYGEEPHPSVSLIHPERESFDLRLIGLVIARFQMPVLGVCGGCQLLNISQGGSLIQDIGSVVPDSRVVHHKKNGWTEGFARHDVKVLSGSMLDKIYQTECLLVPTSHHQAVKVVGRGLKAVAWADDMIIEAIEMPGRRFVLGVQWHPERDFETNQMLFEHFIRQAGSKD